MALDVGDRNIGIAVSDALQITAQGRPTLRRTSWQADVQYLRQVAEESDIGKIIVGKPLHMDGQESPQSRKIVRFATKLSKTLSLPVILWDERLTSFAAEQHLEEAGLSWRERRKHVDKVAAMFILQDYLDSLKG
ncbi:MAG TPA: Holliday junction resolvase RuvX [Terriglobia bacterium]|nr:Holliday junction resolvase RuvX [Terriglobia bacterium]